jgi:hypothetical protein
VCCGVCIRCDAVRRLVSACGDGLRASAHLRWSPRAPCTASRSSLFWKEHPRPVRTMQCRDRGAHIGWVVVQSGARVARCVHLPRAAPERSRFEYHIDEGARAQKARSNSVARRCGASTEPPSTGAPRVGCRPIGCTHSSMGTRSQSSLRARPVRVSCRRGSATAKPG